MARPCPPSSSGSRLDVGPQRRPLGAWNLLVVATYLPVAVGSAGWIALREGDPDAATDLIVGSHPARDLAAGLAPALLIVAASAWAAKRFTWANRMELAMARLFGPVGLGTSFVIAAASATGEELLFRGALQPHLGLLGTSLLFALVHVPVERELALWPSFALLAGLVLGGLFDWTGALLAPVTCHFAINLLNLRRLARRASQEDEGFFQ